MKRISSIILLVILSISLTSCKVTNQKKYQGSFLVLFNTITEIVAYTDNKEDFEIFTRFIYDNLEEYHQLYDKYNNYPDINNIKTINDNAGIAPVKVDQRIIDLILFSKEMHRKTEGKVNIAMGSVLEIWHNYRTEGIEYPENAKLPPMKLLEEANTHTDINKIIIDEATSTVYLEDKSMKLDVGAIAKGYATEQIIKLALNQDYTDFLISVGGNTRAVGTKGSKDELWSVGIQNPDKASQQSSLYTLGLTDLSLVASGDYERYYTVDGKQYHHIIDPDTLMPADYYSAISIVCEDSGLADALSTAIYNMPYEEGNSLIESFGNVEALWVYSDGSMKYSDHFMDYVK